MSDDVSERDHVGAPLVDLKSARHRQGMTLAEVADFLALAGGNGYPSDTPVRVVAKFGGRISHLELRLRDVPKTAPDSEAS